jgi:biofilm protein TabA
MRITFVFSFFITFATNNQIHYDMKKLILLFTLIAGIASFTAFKSASDPSKWSNEEVDKWFNKKEWLNGWNVKPDSSINRRELAISYFRNKERWDKAFAFLRDNNLVTMEAKKYVLDDDNLFATISESVTKNVEDTKFEAHRKYIDIQHVIVGSEQMSITPMAQKKDALVAYDPAKDVEFMTVNGTSSYVATPDKVFIFFPSDIHRPSVKIGDNKPVRKVVVKVKVD